MERSTDEGENPSLDVSINTLGMLLAGSDLKFNYSDPSWLNESDGNSLVHKKLYNLLHILKMRNTTNYEQWIPPFILLIEKKHHTVLDCD